MGGQRSYTCRKLFVGESLEIAYTSISPPFGVILLNIQFFGYLIKYAFTDIGLELCPCFLQLSTLLYTIVGTMKYIVAE
jgi:hypothetical protein